MTNDQPAAEQMPEALPQEHLDKLVNTWAAGFVSGMTTLLLQGHNCTDPTCPVPALAEARARTYVALTFSDPAFRLSIERDAEKKWHNPDVELGTQVMTTYPAAWHRGGQ